MNMEELKKLLKENRVHFYSYWGKGKLEDLARINKLIPEPEPETKAEPKVETEPETKAEPKVETEPEPKAEPKVELKTETETKAELKTELKQKPKTTKRPDYKRMRKIRNEPISVKFIDIETKEEKTFPSIYKGAQFLDKCPQTIAHYGRKKGIWNKKYQIIIE